MRKIVILIFVLIAGFAYGQKKKKPASTPVTQTETPAPVVEVPKSDSLLERASQISFNMMIDHYRKKRELALRWNDGAAAQSALYDLIAETGNDSLAYLLAVSFYENQQYASAVLVAKDLLGGNAKNINYLQLSALSFEGLGLKDKALANYESVYLLAENTAILYKMSNLQYELKLNAECKANVEILLTRPDLDSLSVNVPIGTKNKEFPLKVAILNLKGLLLAQSGDKAGAKKAFDDALVIAPDFPMAKENIAKLK